MINNKAVSGQVKGLDCSWQGGKKIDAVKVCLPTVGLFISSLLRTEARGEKRGWAAAPARDLRSGKRGVAGLRPYWICYRNSRPGSTLA